MAANVPTVLDVIAAWLVSLGSPAWLAYLIVWVVGAGLLAGVIMGVGGLMSFVMRKVMARVQQRTGPNRVGPFGLMQFLADAVKLTAKEDIIPAKVDRWTFLLAPFAIILPIILAFAPIPFGPGIVLSDLRVGLLFILAVSAAAPLGELMAGWASNNKYSMLGALRAAAMDVSYEIPLMISAVSVILLAGTLNTQQLVDAQQNLWYIILQPIGAFIFFAGALAKAGVIPLDLAEADSEIVAGFSTEYSGFRFGMMFLGIFVSIVLVSCLTVLLYFGGWLVPGFGTVVPVWTGFIWFTLKVIAFILLVITIWFTVPRIRIDQFLSTGWKVLFPLSILNLIITVGEIYYLKGGL